MPRFWVYIGTKIQGPVDIPSLRKVPGFNLLTQVCQEGEQTWRMADEVIEIKSYFLSPPRPNSFALDSGNAAPKLELTPPPALEELVLPEPNTLEIIAGKKSEPGTAASPNALRAVCDVCGYKNPRDVSVCMKCGEKLKGAAVPLSSSPNAPVGDPSKEHAGLPPVAAGMTKMAAAPAAAPAPALVPVVPSPEPDIKSGAMVEVSLSKLLLGVAVASLVAGGSFFGYRSWKKKHTPHSAPIAAAPRPAPRISQRRTYKAAKHYDHPPVRRTPAYEPAALPGVSGSQPARPARMNPPEEQTEGANYRVVAEATPLQKRHSSPINSPYAVKHRADKGFWSTQEEHAIQQVQRYRIYGGQRTIDRNVEILMQILRDREYNTAFESGKRLYLYNDLDWSATDKEGPVYEVRLTFSGGKEADGTPKKPLHFAFASDLERGTVEPGGLDQIRSNTLHAFFDESRIPPEDRRAIAKDTEELVIASQPGASPLAFDTVVRQFAKVYSADALSRVAAAYGLSDVKKKLAHDPRLGSEESVDAVMPVQKSAPPASQGKTEQAATAARSQEVSKTPQPFAPANGQAVDFRMESGPGRERTLLVRAVSHASASRMWELITGYDRLKQFMPDMLVSEREGQDGAATIVHTVCLTRFMIFVFKINLHLRIIEHPQQRLLEFEKIAGEFESFRGSLEITTDPATHDSQIAFRATLVPTGHTMNWALESMARRLLIPQINAIRAKAETN